MSESPPATPGFQLFDDSVPYTTIRCLKEEQLRSVWLLDISGRGLTTLKRWPVNWKLRWKSLFGQSQPQRQVTGAWRLLEAGVNTPQPATPVYRAGQFYQLEMPFIEGTTVDEVLKNASPAAHSELARIARELGEIVRRLAEARLRHRDLKLENVILKPPQSNQGPPSLWLIDPVGIRLCNSLETSLICMLDRLAIQPLNEGIPLPLSLQIICIRSAIGNLSRQHRRQFFQRLRNQLKRSVKQA
ncbi:hypothetical protein Enr10x_07290 [Gimesia panareensis]|uniref:Non-specific serine/threonine protein kinase n=1 Tax=Gimesia panareensis TaxID=2527978 RepID=A0A517Q1D0_9PLAN|nr:hypothetical protein [Gimesia panareensis]QDT25433.1 hypothetical protein Enr10x_07290 [Gimesia panareensis]